MEKPSYLAGLDRYEPLELPAVVPELEKPSLFDRYEPIEVEKPRYEVGRSNDLPFLAVGLLEQPDRYAFPEVVQPVYEVPAPAALPVSQGDYLERGAFHQVPGLSTGITIGPGGLLEQGGVRSGHWVEEGTGMIRDSIGNSTGMFVDPLGVVKGPGGF